MAKLGEPYPFPTYDFQIGFGGNMKEQEKALAKIPKNRLIDFPVADGRALYFVKSLSPLVLQHIDYLDGYAIPDAHLRGLRREDVEQLIERRIAFDKIFGG
jgi:hypothetical protein